MLPEAALTGYFLEGAVYELALPARRFADDLARAWRSACGERRVDLVCGFFENDDGTYYNSALYLAVDEGEARIVHVHRKMFLADLRRLRRRAFSLARKAAWKRSIRGSGRAAMLVCEDAVARARADDRGAQRRAYHHRAERVAGARRREGRGARVHPSLARDSLDDGGRARRLHALRGPHGVRGRKGHDRNVVRRESARRRRRQRAADSNRAFSKRDLDLREIDFARASLPLLGDLDAVLPDLLARSRPSAPATRARVTTYRVIKAPVDRSSRRRASTRRWRRRWLVRSCATS